jgi:hypothetical protein
MENDKLVPYYSSYFVVENCFRPHLHLRKIYIILNTLINKCKINTFKKIDINFTDMFYFNDLKRPIEIVLEYYVIQDIKNINYLLDEILTSGILPLKNLVEIEAIYSSVQLQELITVFPRYKIYAFCLNRKLEIIQILFKPKKKLLWRKLNRIESIKEKGFIIIA